MNRTTRTGTVLGALAALVLLTAFECSVKRPTAPATGTITQITSQSGVCWDVQTDAGERPSVAILYQPAGTDPDGSPWPTKSACVTPTDAAKYVVGGKYP